jgi:hypothetical protein
MKAPSTAKQKVCLLGALSIYALVHPASRDICCSDTYFLIPTITGKKPAPPPPDDPAKNYFNVYLKI